MYFVPDDGSVPTLPAWSTGPPENELPVPVPVRGVLARTDDVAIALVGGRVSSTGVEIDLTVRRRDDEDDDAELHTIVHGHAYARRPGPAAGRLLLGVELPDGGVATNVGPALESADDDAPRLTPRDSHGGDRRVDATFWLTPVPAEGDLVFVCACPALGVPETRTVVPAAVLAGAAERVEVLWAVEPRVARPPAPPPVHPPAGGWFERVLGPADAPASSGAPQSPGGPPSPDEPAPPRSPA
ncbi:hypothetical protein AB6N24_07900 [Cellulomonas sp. 179-A 4D5 NHS]|uniref:hypothetical protein n=1 Tax=Cellulomonas sp. 179-A 4D5 NHS TaxID=3142378 RepID=UPI0039A190B4